MSFCDTGVMRTVDLSCPAPGGGTRDHALAILLEDWLAATLTVTSSSKTLTNIVLAAGGKRAWRFNMPAGAGSMTSGTTGRDEAGNPTISSSVPVIFQKRDVTTLQDLDFFINNRFILLVPNNVNEGGYEIVAGYADGSDAAQGVGLRGTDSFDSASAGGSTILTFEPIEGQEPHNANWILKGATETATQAVITALVTPTS